MNNRYNAIRRSFIADPFISDTWGSLWSNSAGTVPVTLGSTLWYPNADSLLLKQRPLYNTVTKDTNSDMNCFFYRYDRAYIHDVTLYCNFADGLVRQDTPTQAPVNGGDNTPVPVYLMANILKLQLTSYYWDEFGNTQENGSIVVPIPHFNTAYSLEQFTPKTIDIPATARAVWYEMEIVKDTANLPAWSTLGIDTAYQSSRCLVWAESTLSHTFDTKIHASVGTGNGGGWPT